MAKYAMPRGGYIGDTYSGGTPPAGGGGGYTSSITSSSSSGLPELRPQVVSNLSGALNGELPQDVVDQINQHAAEFGVASGMPGSEFAGYQGLRNLGLTSLARMQHAEDLLAPGYHQSNAYNYAPSSPTDTMAWTNHSNAINGFNRGGGGGEVPAYVNNNQSNYRGGNQPPGMQPQGAPDHHALVGDFLAKYLPGSGGAGASMAPAPMGVNPSYPSYPTAGTGGGDNWGDVPGFYAGSREGYRGGPTTGDLADQGVIDPLFGQPQSYTGDVNSDWGDEIYA